MDSKAWSTPRLSHTPRMTSSQWKLLGSWEKISYNPKATLAFPRPTGKERLCKGLGVTPWPQEPLSEVGAGSERGQCFGFAVLTVNKRPQEGVGALGPVRSLNSAQGPEQKANEKTYQNAKVSVTNRCPGLLPSGQIQNRTPQAPWQSAFLWKGWETGKKPRLSKFALSRNLSGLADTFVLRRGRAFHSHELARSNCLTFMVRFNRSCATLLYWPTALKSGVIKKVILSKLVQATGITSQGCRADSCPPRMLLVMGECPSVRPAP